jgi:hypothetical protein
MLTNAQKTTLANGIKASTVPAVVAALAAGDRQTITDWINGNSTQDAWHSAVTATMLREAMDLTKFDALSAGKRDSWWIMMDFARDEAVDFGKAANRKAVLDVWGRQMVLRSCRASSARRRTASRSSTLRATYRAAARAASARGSSTSSAG